MQVRASLVLEHPGTIQSDSLFSRLLNAEHSDKFSKEVGWCKSVNIFMYLRFLFHQVSVQLLANNIVERTTYKDYYLYFSGFRHNNEDSMIALQFSVKCWYSHASFSSIFPLSLRYVVQNAIVCRQLNTFMRVRHCCDTVSSR